MLINKFLRHAVASVAVAGVLLAVPPTTASADEQYIAIPSIRVGPYNAMGTGYFGGIIDYLNDRNIKHNGINGVKFIYQECETEYNAAKNVECYQRLMTNDKGQKMLAWDPYGTPLAYAVIGKLDACVSAGSTTVSTAPGPSSRLRARMSPP